MSKRRRLRCSGWRRQTNQGNRHDREIEHDRNGQQASGEEGGGGEFSRFTEQGCFRRTAGRRSKALIHGRAIGASHARLARRWASRLVRPLLHALSAVLAALRRRAYQSGNRGSARNSGCCCSPPEIGATFNSLLAVSARLMRVMHRPKPVRSPESREPKRLGDIRKASGSTDAHLAFKRHSCRLCQPTAVQRSVSRQKRRGQTSRCCNLASAVRQPIGARKWPVPTASSLRGASQ